MILFQMEKKFAPTTPENIQTQDNNSTETNTQMNTPPTTFRLAVRFADAARNNSRTIDPETNPHVTPEGNNTNNIGN